MLPMKLDLTEELAATLRQLRLDHPVNGEVLTAEKLSKAIGNNRAWMSQIESRRLKKIKREDVIKIYRLLLNESNEKEIERIAELDLCSPFDNRYDSENPNAIYVNDSYSEGIISLDNLMSDLRDVLLEEYKKMNSDGDRNTLLGCVESMIDNFRNDYKHTHQIYTALISYADPEYFGEKYAKEYFNSLNDVCREYTLLLHEAFVKADTDSFLGYAVENYNTFMEDVKTITPNDSFEDLMDFVMYIENYSKRTFTYIERIKEGKVHQTDIDLDTIFKMLTDMLSGLLSKLKLNYTFSNTTPSFKSDKSELDAKQLEINNAIMLAIKHISGKK